MGKIVIRTNYQRVAMKNKNMYVTRATSFSKIGKDELVSMVANDSSLPRGYVAAVTDGLFNQIKQMVLNGHSVEVPHLGLFKFGISCKGVEAEEDISAENVKARKILFSPCKELKDALRGVTLETVLGTKKTDEGN